VAEEVSAHRARGWRSPVNALMLTSVANYLSFATWNALHTSFAIDAIHFDGTEMGDIAPTSSVAFSINHIAAVLLPIPLGIVWDIDSAAVFVIGAAMAGVALGLSLLVPHDPNAGNEAIFATRRLRAAAAE
jgi:hypothetical protein